MGKIQTKKGIWVPHELGENNKNQWVTACLSLLNKQHRKSFLWQIITSDEKWIFYDNSKRITSWINLGEPSTLVTKHNRFGKKAILCVWWNIKGVLNIKNNKNSYCRLLPASVNLLESRIKKKTPVYRQRRTSSKIVA